MRRPAEAAHAGLQLDTLRRRAQRDRRNLVVELLHEDPLDPVARLVVELPHRPVHQPVVRPVAPAGDVERARARKEVEDVVLVEELRAPAEQHHVDSRLRGRAGKAHELGECRHLVQGEVDAVVREDVLKLGREAGGGGILLRVRERELERLRREDLCLKPWRGDRGRAGHRRWNPPGRAGRNAAHGALHEPARLRIGERRAPRHEPEEAARQCRECSPGGRMRSRRDPGEPRWQDAARQHSVHPVVRGREDELPRFDRGHVPVVEVPLQHEPARRAGSEPEGAARRAAALPHREEDRPRDLLVQPRHRVLQGHAERAVVERLDADVS